MCACACMRVFSESKWVSAGQAAGHSWVLRWGGCVWATKHVSGWAPPAAGGPICSLEPPGSSQPTPWPLPRTTAASNHQVLIPHLSPARTRRADEMSASRPPGVETEGGGKEESGRGGGGRRGGTATASRDSEVNSGKDSGIGGENTQVLCKHGFPAAPNVNTWKHEALQEFGFSLMLNLSGPVSDPLSPPVSPAIVKAISSG